MTTGSRDWTGLTLADGRYRVEARIGEGGMGTVYRASDRNLDAEVVIKVPLRSMLDDPDFARRFEVEVKSLAKLSHPQIVKIMDVGAWDGLPFAVMQYLPGGSLEDRRPAPPGGAIGALDPKDLTGWLAGIARALDYLHKAGYVHRDVKPGNILFDAQGHPFLSDFGVVKVAASAAEARGAAAAMTGTGMVVGTPEYMAPELVMGEAFDGRADQYALAVTAYEMLSGRRPFEDATKTKLLVLHSTRPAPPPGEFSPWITERLSEAVLRGLAKAPADRYPDCSALAEVVLSAVAADFGEKPDLVRFRCPSCGKTLGLPSANFARLRQLARALDCPGCKTSIRAGSAKVPASTLVEPSTARQGTMVESPVPRSRTLVETVRRGAPTVVEGSEAAPIGRSNRTVVEPARRSSATVVERPRTMVETGLIVPPSEPLRDRPAPEGTGPPVAVWVGVGVASAAVLAACVGLLMSGGGKATSVSGDATKTPLNTGSNPSGPKPPIKVETQGDSLAKIVAPAPPPPAPKKSETEGPSIAAVPEPSPDPAMENPEPVNDVPGAGGIAEKNEEPDPDDRPLTKAPTFVELKKVEAAHPEYAGQAIELRQLYYVHGFRLHGDSPGEITVSEAKRGLTKDYKLVVQPDKEMHTLELDPAVAGRLAGTPFGSRGGGPDPTRLAALTIKVVRRKIGSAADWRIQVVGLELFRRMIPVSLVPKHGFKRKLRVNVSTLVITPEAEAPSDDATVWESSSDRLGILVRRMKTSFDNYLDRVKTMTDMQRMAKENAALNRLDAEALKNQQLIEAQGRRAIGSVR